jgi:hypothetical protein
MSKHAVAALVLASIGLGMAEAQPCCGKQGDDATAVETTRILVENVCVPVNFPGLSRVSSREGEEDARGRTLCRLSSSHPRDAVDQVGDTTGKPRSVAPSAIRLS